ncbi:hypothetical protein [Methylobacterium sp. J-068]|uniref:hypothetical protein n=1 Tax=Methylobacterium sp. J-068 TaxID=2836649 RepID=UPI001FB9D5A3|nr:hypothetical protein [Methylobacterium sp. J-068]MCJ2034075.1 hypothetical protein [Methylobacterium sp. J-068]
MVSSLTAQFRRLGLLGLGLAAGFAGVTGAQAQVGGYGQAAPYGAVPYGYADSYAGPLLHGDYIGAPLTRVPRPTELVPSAWGYGTYGVPTVAGIRSAPVGTPTVYVIDAPRAAARAPRPARPRILSRARDGRWSPVSETRAAPAGAEQAGAARVITVGVQQHQARLR